MVQFRSSNRKAKCVRLAIQLAGACHGRAGAIELGDHAEALNAFRGIKAEESSPVGPLAVRAVVLDANGWKEGAKGDAHTLSAAPLLPEERALITPLLRD